MDTRDTVGGHLLGRIMGQSAFIWSKFRGKQRKTTPLKRKKLAVLNWLKSVRSTTELERLSCHPKNSSPNPSSDPCQRAVWHRSKESH